MDTIYRAFRTCQILFEEFSTKQLMESSHRPCMALNYSHPHFVPGEDKQWQETGKETHSTAWDTRGEEEGGTRQLRGQAASSCPLFCQVAVVGFETGPASTSRLL